MKSVLTRLPLMPVLLALGACSGQVTVGITDAPVDDAVAVVIQFDGIDLIGTDGGTERFTFAEPKAIDLLALQGGERELLLNEGVFDGDFEAIRLRISADGSGDDSYVETIDGVVALQLDDGDEALLRISRSFSVGFQDSVDFTIDFDLRQSIREPSESDDPYRLVPVLRIVNAASVGKVSGAVNASLIDDDCKPAVYAFEGKNGTPDDVGSGNGPFNTGLVLLSEDTWSYAIGSLRRGDYTIALTCEAGSDDPDTNDDIEFMDQANVVVERGQTATADF